MGEAFEWDEVKAAANYAKHGVSFEAATKAFKDAFAIERLDDRRDYGEDRYILTRTAERRGARRRLHREKRSYPDHLGAPRNQA